jgi:hypothetical protein
VSFNAGRVQIQENSAITIRTASLDMRDANVSISGAVEKLEHEREHRPAFKSVDRKQKCAARASEPFGRFGRPGTFRKEAMQ